MRNKKSCKAYIIENKQLNDRSKPILISNYFKCKWLNSPNKWQEISRMYKSTWSNYMLPTRDSPYLDIDVNRFKMKDGKKTFHANKGNRVAWLIPDKIYFKSKCLQETKEDIIY